MNNHTKEKFVLFFWKFTNVEFKKDQWMIPYYMAKNHNLDVYIFTKDNETEYEQKDWIKITTYSKRRYWEFIKFIRKHKPEYLMVFYNINVTAIIILMYKMMHPSWKVYVKHDMWYQRESKNLQSPKRVIKQVYYALHSLCTKVLSVEVERNIDLIKQNYIINNDILHYIPNGFEKTEEYSYDWSIKENIVLTVWRLWTEQKNTKLFLEVAKQILEKHPSWKFVAIGKIYDEDNFVQYKEEFFKKNPHLHSSIQFLWPIYDKKELNAWYKKSKIFLLTSIREGSPIVFPESTYFGNIIVSTDVWDLKGISNNYTYCKKANVWDNTWLAEALDQAIQEKMSKQYWKAQHEYTKNHKDREHIVHKIHTLLTA